MDALIFRRNPWMTALSCVPFAVLAAFWIAYALGNPHLVILTPHLFILGLVTFFGAWRRKPYAKRTEVRVEVDETTLRVGDEVHPRASITNAQLVPVMSQKPLAVRVSRGLLPDIDIAVADEAEGHALLRALGWDPSQTTATFRCGSLAVTRYRWALFAMLVPAAVLLGIFSSAYHMGRFSIFPFIGTLLVPALWPSSLTVGVDGVLLRWLWIREFIPTKNIQLVTRFERGSGRNRVRGVSILTSEGKTVEIPLTNEEQIAIIRQRIEEVVALAGSGADVADDALLLSRGDLSVRDWITRLRALGEGATAQLRVAPVMPERLWRVALDPVAPAPSRIAAAIALSGQLDDEGRSKLEEAAKATAAPRLRVALESVARGTTDEEMETAITDVEKTQ